ncbi:MAG TPA: hypothetical protein VF533_01585 [Solirubrobacteraceae bacterium]|jgi:hypothetical protein
MRLVHTVPALALAATLALPAGAGAAKAGAVKLGVPDAGQVAVLSADVGKKTGKKKPKLKAKSVPSGVSVIGGVTPSGKLVVAVLRPRDATKGGTIKLSAKARGKALKLKKVKKVGAALDGGSLPAAACKDAKLGKALGKKLSGGASSGDAKALGGLLSRRLCGKPATVADASVLDRLGLGPAPSPPPPPPVQPTGGTTPVTPVGGGGGTPKPPPGNGGGNNGGNGGPQCANGIDDDGDGQVDHTSKLSGSPDPGCSSATDTNETGEVPVAAECAESSYVSQGTDNKQGFFSGINSGCPTFNRVWISVPTGPASKCNFFGTSGAKYDCGVVDGLIDARAQAEPTEMADVDFDLSGPVDCSKPYTIAFYEPDGTVAELVEQMDPCVSTDGGGGEPQKKQCADGLDNDGDGQTDAGNAEGATDPDPGCTSPDDDSEGSETTLSTDCIVNKDDFQSSTTVGVRIDRDTCGEITGAWLRPPGTPTACGYAVGDGADFSGCSVVGKTVGVFFNEAVGQPLHLAAALDAEPVCDMVGTLALQRPDGSFEERRFNWPC